MQIPAGAMVKDYTDAELGSLLVGRFRNEDGNFFAIRTQIATVPEGKPVEPYLVILTPSIDDQPAPYLCVPNTPPRVLDLGTEWTIGVSVDRNAPCLYRASLDDPKAILIRCGNEFFLDMREDGAFLNFNTGLVEFELPDQANVASWPSFSIYLAQPGEEGPGHLIYQWPEKTGPLYTP